MQIKFHYKFGNRHAINISIILVFVSNQNKRQIHNQIFVFKKHQILTAPIFLIFSISFPMLERSPLFCRGLLELIVTGLRYCCFCCCSVLCTWAPTCCLVVPTTNTFNSLVVLIESFRLRSFFSCLYVCSLVGTQTLPLTKYTVNRG